MMKPELLAPAGDLSRCITAIRYGADAVYIGGTRFSLRSRASNFTMDDIRSACAFAKEHGAAIHVTVNMIPHDEDLEGLEEYLRALQDAGVKAIIAASPSVMRCCRRCAPQLEVHCSTQMSVTSSEAVRFLRDSLGIHRVVLARECTMDQVRRITAESGIETEAFIHGGMCVNYSGRCTLSNRMTLRDANRGGCAQSCRWMYHLSDDTGEKEELFTMGSKDLCAFRSIYDLMEAGVSSLKIEGRMKTEYYIASVVSTYRRLIDETYAYGKCLPEDRLAEYEKEFRRTMNRESWGGFLREEAGLSSLIYHDASDADVNHDFLGKVRSYDPEKGTMIMETRNYFERGEKAEILAPGEPVRQFAFESLRNENGEYLEASRHPMALLEVPVPFAVREDDFIRRAR